MAQSLACILIHIIFSTKNRKSFIVPEIMDELHSYMVGIAKTYDCQIHEIGGVEDHVHLLLSTTPKNPVL
jgi:REP element-mobilizing transposase RayT